MRKREFGGVACECIQTLSGTAYSMCACGRSVRSIGRRRSAVAGRITRRLHGAHGRAVERMDGVLARSIGLEGRGRCG